MKHTIKRSYISWTILAACSLTSVISFAQKAGKASGKPELLFASGFEGSTRVVADTTSNDFGARMEYITGVDKTMGKKGDWDKDWGALMGGGHMQVQYTGGDSSKRYARVVTEPGNPRNQVLKFWLDDSWLASENERKARVQTNIYGLKNGLKEFYQSVRVFLHEDFNALKEYPYPIWWLTLSEFWNNEWWVKGEKYGFRTGLVIGKLNAEDRELSLFTNAEDAGRRGGLWKETNTDVKVPIGKWFTMEYYFKEGNEQEGRFYLAITPDGGSRQVIYNFHHATHNTKDPAPDGFTGYNPMKLYTSKELVAYMKSKGKTLQIYWDDFQLWKNKRPDELPR